MPSPDRCHPLIVGPTSRLAQMYWLLAAMLMGRRTTVNTESPTEIKLQNSDLVRGIPNWRHGGSGKASVSPLAHTLGLARVGDIMQPGIRINLSMPLDLRIYFSISGETHCTTMVGKI